MRHRPSRLLLALPALGLFAGPVFFAGPAAAGDPPPAPAAPTAPAPGPTVPLEDSLQRGARHFDQAIAWVARGGSLGRTRDFYATLDSKWDLDDNHNEGTQVVWFQTPARMRMENQFVARNQIKVLDGEKAWTWDAGDEGHVMRLHGTPDAEADLKQLKEDFQRLQDLTDFLTLEGLKGPGVLFEFQGAVRGSGVYQGEWLKIARRSPDGRKITFWLANEAGPDGQPRATWPGVVRVEGDSAQGLFTEDWILKDWEMPSAKPRAFRYPMKVQGWRFPAGESSSKGQKFLTAILTDVQMNQGVDAAKFAPPAAPAGPGAPK